MVIYDNMEKVNNVIDIIEEQLTADPSVDLVFCDETRKLDTKNRLILPSGLISLFTPDTDNNIFMKIWNPYPHTIIFPYQNEIRKIIRSIGYKQHNNWFISSPFWKITIDKDYRILLPKECLWEGDNSIRVIGEKFWIRIYSESIYTAFLKSNTGEDEPIIVNGMYCYHMKK